MALQAQAKLTHLDIIDEVSCFSGENKDVETWVKRLKNKQQKELSACQEKY